MMNFDDAHRILAKIRYKPGFTIASNSWSYDTFILRISHVDVESPRIVYFCIGNISESDFVHRVYNELLNWERHECGEFFKYDGVAIFNPHSDVNKLKGVL